MKNPDNSQCLALLALLSAVGLRFCEGVSLRQEDFIGRDHAIIHRAKRGSWTIIPIPPSTFLYAEKYSLPSGQIFTISYKYFYRFLKSSGFSIKRKKNDKYEKVSHSFRYATIERLLFEERFSLDQIRHMFGWNSKSAVAYYL